MGCSNGASTRPGLADLVRPVARYLSRPEHLTTEVEHDNLSRRGQTRLHVTRQPPSDDVSPPAPLLSLQVRDSLLSHSFNLNPAIMSAVEVEMAEGVVETATAADREGAPSG